MPDQCKELFVNPTLSKLRDIAFGVLGGLFAAGLLYIVAAGPRGKPVQLLPPAPTATAAFIQVHVAGEVLSPGVYALPSESIVQDAITAAGGPTGNADLGRLNLALILGDGQQVYVPNSSQPTAAPSTNALNSGQPATPSAGNKLDINTATADELEALPEIGEVMAARIVQYRAEHGRFEAIEDITEVNGIGPATFEAIKDLITVGP
jgi:competence protein ComEA